MRKRLTLPSGATCVVRKLSRMDFLSCKGVPSAFAEATTKPTADGTPSQEQIEFGLMVSKVALTKACGPLTQPDGRSLTIVDKPFHACADNEVSIEELEDADAEAIIAAVAGMTNLGKEAAATAQPFPGEQA